MSGDRVVTVQLTVKIRTPADGDFIDQIGGAEAASAAIRENLMDMGRALCFIQDHAAEVTGVAVTIEDMKKSDSS